MRSPRPRSTGLTRGPAEVSIVRRHRLVVALCALGLAACVGGPGSEPGDSGDAFDLGQQELPLAPAGWELVWADEFNGPAGSGPDASKWQLEVGGSGFGNNEREYYSSRPENVSMDGRGSLAITARRETVPGSSCWYGTCQYSSGRMNTAGRFTLQYGRVEARIKVPGGAGIWPAFWMLGADIGSVGWPTCGEIDVMEVVGQTPSTAYGTLHGPGYSGGNGVSAGYTLPNGARFADGFHEFALEWQTNVVRFYVDGQLYATRTPSDTRGGRWVYDHPFFLILNLAVGGNWPGDPNGSTPFPAQMLVDYVRVYRPGTPPPPGQGQGSIVAEYWDGLDETTTLATFSSNPRFPGQPSSRESLSRFATPVDRADRFGTRIRGYVVPPLTGDYVFFLASDDSSELHLGTNEDASTKRRIASVDGWTSVGEFEKQASQRSSSIRLEAGRRYYIEALAKDGLQGDHLEVAWTMPGQPRAILDGAYLSPYAGATQRDAYATLEAENRDTESGVLFQTTTDTGGGFNAGWIANGDWLAFRNVAFGTNGAGSVDVRVASGANAATGTIELRLDSTTGPRVGTVGVGPTGGWQTWTTKHADVAGAAGTHDLYLVFTSGQPSDFLNVNWLRFVPASVRDAFTRIEAESRDGASGVLFEDCTDVGAGFDAGWIANGDSLVYRGVAFGQGGATRIDARVASGAASGVSGLVEFHVDSKDGPLLGSFAIADTGGWQTWRTVPAAVASSPSGVHDVHVVFKSAQPADFANLNWFQFVRGGSSGGTSSGGGTSTGGTSGGTTSASCGASPTSRLRVRNNCGETLWLDQSTNVPGTRGRRIDPGECYDVPVPDTALASTRFWPRTGCDANGDNCTTGQSSGPCPASGCQPPIESKFEVTWADPRTCAPQGAPASCVTWYNTSQVDGYTLPFRVTPRGPGANEPGCVPSDCGGLELSQCPSAEDLSEGGRFPQYAAVDLRVMDPRNPGRVIGCMSPCKKLNYPAPWGYGQSEQSSPTVDYCCPTPPISPQQCSSGPVVQSGYVNRLQTMCPSVYSYAYDDADGLHTCPAQTGFDVVFCPNR
ncbi:MAG: carbohydrate-binding protein [Polyangiales bacterium]